MVRGGPAAAGSRGLSRGVPDVRCRGGGRVDGGLPARGSGPAPGGGG